MIKYYHNINKYKSQDLAFVYYYGIKIWSVVISKSAYLVENLICVLTKIAYIAFKVSYESAYGREPIEILYFKTSLGEKSSSTLIGRELFLTSLGEKSSSTLIGREISQKSSALIGRYQIAF